MKHYYFRAISEGQAPRWLFSNPKRIRAFLGRVRSLRCPKETKYYLKVSYGNHENNMGLTHPFKNEGWYSTKKDLIMAFFAFNKLKESDFVTSGEKANG